MKITLFAGVTALVLSSVAPGQTADQREGAPIYRVTVVQRTAQAVNYHYRFGPTKIDFRGTVLLPKAKGEATVESERGRTKIEAKLEGLSAPQRFGREYLTYVLWAITPEGRPHNIGELIPNASDKARVDVTTDLQAFALIVTAEPYSAVQRPSDVVVLENEVRADTLGKVEPVVAKYELLPRGEYTWHVPSDLGAVQANSRKVSMHEYEAIVELYQARNAVGIAREAHADRYASETFAQAQRLLAEAERLDKDTDFRRVVQSAREAAQTAEDARAIAEQRQQAERLRDAHADLSEAQAKLSNAQQAKEQALDAAQQARAEADAAQAQARAALEARDQAQAEAQAARERAARSIQAAQSSSAQAAVDQRRLMTARQRDARMHLLENLKRALPTRDTSRGLVATLSDDCFRGAELGRESAGQTARIAAILAGEPGLSVSIEGYTDSAARESLSRERAEAVRRELVAHGVPARSVSAAGLGTSRPLASNANVEGRKENSRVEIVITGDPIGRLPLWDQTYSLKRPD